MIAMIIIAVFYLYVENNDIELTVDDLSIELSDDLEKTNTQYYNKQIKLSGKVKTYYSFENQPNLLELKTKDEGIKILCSIPSAETDSLAKTLTLNTPVVVEGKYKGINKNTYPKEVHIEIKDIKLENK